MSNRVITPFILMFACFDLMAASLDIALSDESAKFQYQTPMGGSTLGRSEMMGGFLYHSDDKYMAEFGILVIDMAGSKTPGLELGVGPKFFYVETDVQKASGMALGGQARYKMREFPRYFLTGRAFYAPSIVSFGDAEDMIEWAAFANYELLPTADAYVGFHHIHVEFDNGGRIIDESILFGLKFRY